MKIYISRRAARIVAICTAVMLVSAMLTQLVLASTPGTPVGGSSAQQGVGGKQQAQAEKPRPSSPTAAYYLQGDADNSGSGATTFSSSDTLAGVYGAWIFYATGAGETALRADCFGGSRTCWGAYLQGEAYGSYSQSENYSSGYTSIGVYGVSDGPGGQGVAGVNNQAGGYGGVFTATGTSGIGIKAQSTSGYGLAAYSENSPAVYGLSGTSTNITTADYSILGGAYVGSYTAGVGAVSDLGSAVYAQTYGNNGGTAVTAGVSGVDYMSNGGQPIANAGVYGFCLTCNGVFGETSGSVGVRGKATGGASSYGGYFTAASGTALYGYSSSGFGVYGYSSSSYGLSGGSSSGYGMRGASTSNYGLYVTTSTGPAAGYVKTTSGLVGLRAVNPDTTAGHFAIVSDGNVQVNGTLHATGGITAVSATDQGDKQMYAGVSTQNLSSDAGTAKLVNGRAIIKIDPLFAQTANLAGGYRVFVTPHAFDTIGLGVGNMTSVGFEVRELNKGRGNFSFDWKIEAVRKGYEKQRMEAAPAVPDAPPDKQSPSDLTPLEPSNTPPPVVPKKPGTTSSGALVPVTGKP